MITPGQNGVCDFFPHLGVPLWVVGGRLSTVCGECDDDDGWVCVCVWVGCLGTSFE